MGLRWLRAFLFPFVDLTCEFTIDRVPFTQMTHLFICLPLWSLRSPVAWQHHGASFSRPFPLQVILSCLYNASVNLPVCPSVRLLLACPAIALGGCAWSGQARLGKNAHTRASKTHTNTTNGNNNRDKSSKIGDVTWQWGTQSGEDNGKGQ